MTFTYDSGTTDPDVTARDNLAKVVVLRYREAVNWQGTELVGNRSLRRCLRECYDQSNGVLSPDDREMVEHLNVNAYVNLTAMKAGVVQAFLLESLVAADELPWVLAPTPMPELSEAGVEDAVAAVKEAVFGQGFRGDLELLTRDIAREAYLKEKERAEEAAKLMERRIFDQTVEGSWREAMSDFLYNFVTYPYGVIHGPFPVRSSRLAWRGDRIRPVKEIFYRWEAISPWDFWYSPDSPDTQRGTGVCIRKRFTRRDLLDMAKLRSYLKEPVLELLTETETREQYNFKWMSPNPDQMDDQLVHWVRCAETVDALLHYGYFSGRELEEYGVKGLDRREFYNAAVTVIGGFTVQVHVAPPETVLERPVFTASFFRTRDRIPNYGIAQRLRDVERMYLAAIRYLMLNAANASAPVVEIDYTRLAKQMKSEDIANLTPGMVYLIESDLSNSSQPAVRPFMVPSNIGDYVKLMTEFVELSHLVTNIPASLHGTAVGSGANRTFRGMATLQANAVKSIQAAVDNIDRGVFGPMGKLLYNMNMLYEDDPSIKGDCQVHAQGVTGLLAKEIERNNAMDILQIVGAVGAQLGESATPVVDWAIQRIFNAMGVPAEIASRVKFGGAEKGGPAPAEPMPPAGPPAGPEPGAAMPPEAMLPPGMPPEAMLAAQMPMAQPMPQPMPVPMPPGAIPPDAMLPPGAVPQPGMPLPSELLLAAAPPGAPPY
jgi:hypothetical protein